MNVNRRSFFGVAAAAPVAAKQAVTSVLEYEKAAALSNSATMISGGVSSGIPQQVPHEWLKSELKDALLRKKRLAGEQPNSSHHRDMVAFIQIDNRRATSPAVRALLIAEERARREQARELSYLDRRIAEMKEQLGPLAALFEGDA